MPSFVRTLALVLFLGIAPVAAQETPPAPEEVPISTVIRMGAEGSLKSVEVKGPNVTATAKDGTVMTARAAQTWVSWIAEISKQGVDVKILDDIQPWTVGTILAAIVTVLFPALLILILGFLAYTTASTMFGNVTRKASRKTLGGVTRFSDVAGADEAKAQLQEVVSFLKDPAKFSALGARLPKGLLLVGDPGNGKTLLARAVAGEAGVPFHFVSGSDFVDMYVGKGARNVRRMFATAMKKTPSILFIDEIDAVGGKRMEGGNAGEKEHNQTLIELLTRIDGMDSSKGLVVIAATNRPETLDPALLRAGRFDRQIQVLAPEREARVELLRIHSKKVKLAADVDLDLVARATTGFSGADLATLVNEAALDAARDGSPEVTANHFERARDRKLLGGEERKGLALDEEERNLIAVHEAGHALLAALQPECDPIHKATIVPRGRALGFVARLPDGDRRTVRRSKLVADLAVLMAGRAAEEVVLGEENVCSGATGDITEATNLARSMVMRQGMGNALVDLTAPGRFSEQTLAAADRAVEALIEQGKRKAVETIQAHRAALDGIVEALLERETISGEEIDRIVAAEQA